MSILEYSDLVLEFKLRTMEQQLEFAEEVQRGLSRSKSESPCQPLMRGCFRSRLNALQLTALPLGRQGIQLQRKVLLATLRPG